MNTAALREQISRAHQHEASTGQLAQQLEKQLPHLHSAISLADGDRNIVMTRFVTAYIDLVPDLLDAANDVAREAGIESQIKPVLKIAEQFFLQPPAILAGNIKDRRGPGGLHVERIGANRRSRADAVAGIAACPTRVIGIAIKRRILIAHHLVLVETTGGENNALLRSDTQALALMADDCTCDLALVADEVHQRAFEPDGNFLFIDC